jgi:Cof subfamily protein (haloacid dehalogenase superfamily)
MTRVIVTDLDGTILPRKGEISQATIESFRKAGEKNCLRIIATGRNLYSAKQVLLPDFPIDYLIFSSGAGIMRWEDQQIIYRKQLTEKESRAIANHLWDYRSNFTIQREIPDNHLYYYTDLYPVHEDYKRRLACYEPFGTLIHTPDEISGEATQFIVILDGTQLRILEKIKQELANYSVVRSTSPLDNQAIWLEIFAKGINKGTTLEWLLKQLQLSIQHCAGLGNDYNDLDFLNRCPKAYLVANSPTNLHPHYPLVKKDREEGFAEFVSKVL